ncbi:hypothetical protein MCP1_60111 [Candidatus Terasakiella magnetica]|nr:hypothetical protein MCP1_60111 [Candidatus Terasakiella magnetica]
MQHWVGLYERIWRTREAVFDDLLASETSLPRVIALYTRFEACHQIFQTQENGAWVIHVSTAEADTGTALDKFERRGGIVAFGKTIEAPPHYRFDMAGMLNDFAADKDCVIELGAGYGKRLFEMFLGGGAKDLRYIAAEPTAAGRRITAKLSRLVPDMSLDVAAFDFANPCFSPVHGFSRILLFTSWSLMFVDALQDSFFAELAKIPGEVTCVFVEPVGFQINPSNDKISLDQRDTARERRWNLNFFQKLLDAQAAGLVEIEAISTDMFGPLDDTSSIASVCVVTKPALTPP